MLYLLAYVKMKLCKTNRNFLKVIFAFISQFYRRFLLLCFGFLWRLDDLRFIKDLSWLPPSR